MFDTLEANHVLYLDPPNEVDLFYLHLCDPLSTAANHSPIQLYLRHYLGNRLFCNSAVLSRDNSVFLFMDLKELETIFIKAFCQKKRKKVT